MSAGRPESKAPGEATSSRDNGPAELGFLDARWPVVLILGSFFVLTLPLCIAAGGDPNFAFRSPLGVMYICALGMTHFVIMGAIYLQDENRRYFASNRANRLFYFGIPVVIFLVFDLYGALGAAVALPALDLVFRSVIRLADFQHFGRQGYGVSQLLQARARTPFPPFLRRAQNHHFTALSLLLFVTFLSGGVFRPDRAVSIAMLAVVLALFAWNLGGFLIAWKSADRKSAILAPLAYFLLQTASAGLAIYSTALYAFALAMHYVEYHVLMVPRCFHTKLDQASWTDRVFGIIRRRRLVFYTLLLAVAALVTRLTWIRMGTLLASETGSSEIGYRLLISVFDGLFVIHYLIEARIWRFSDPFYRRSLVPLYFEHPPQAAITPAAPSHDMGCEAIQPAPV